MNKIYFLDLGLRNMIINNFNNIDLRSDNGALFENFIFLELIKKAPGYSIINFFRTRDGAEVDFVLNDMLAKSTFEVKYKYFNRPVFFKALSNFNKEEKVKNSYVINNNLNIEYEGLKFIQAYLVEKIFDN